MFVFCSFFVYFTVDHFFFALQPPTLTPITFPLSQLVSEQERIDLEWHAERKVKRRAHVEAVERYEEEKNRETVRLCVGLNFVHVVLFERQYTYSSPLSPCLLVNRKSGRN